ncbi:molybdopterin-dependent oxidoreductase [Corynebacterium cystitidis]|uniref:Oxidoreductase molybdopterin binding domain-containing protein n=1 Tax=Corynebacterium cystitidis DSM 20524 TaxID=1121357 RepID=A0A1H9VDU2_9CORY|nr:molybdopterin-dependent oxidoreductase [Corynebacterium cystitidis]WJY82261.1 Sulfoxide reductase catalytic subunit YedY precursor [Corynebacterium cystitidis DSM 20524]SES19845.1 Oxidoreductase molybdopterin binding domain-containing protein [Corynebacterium cystitidis DSM 20524]SNV77156.1 oxidoreductase molybdopterin binding protein [Corynebacterium cystitidis]
MITDFPVWLRIEHFVNILFVTLFIRSGIEILGTFPKLHSSVHTPAGKQWAQFTVKQKRRKKYYPVAGEYDDYHPIVSLPGHGALGQGRYWHFISVIGWVTLMVIYWALLLLTGQWRRYWPEDLSVFAQAWEDMVSYLAFQIPPAMEGYPFNAVQQLSYGFVVLILPLFMMITGAFQSPAINNRFPRISKAMGGRQVIRTLHFWGLIAYIVFIIIHVAMVVMHGYGHEVSKMVFGHADRPIAGGVIFTTGLAFIVLFHVWATKTSMDNPRLVEKIHNVVVRPLTRTLRKMPAQPTPYRDEQITPASEHRASGMPPATEAYMALVCNDYDDDYVLEIGGFVEKPMRLTLPQLRELADGYSQNTVHHCVQGFSSVGAWDGVPLHRILDLVKPLDGATDVVVHSFQHMTRDDDLYRGSYYYETMPMEEAVQPQSLIAIGYGGDELPIKNGAPMRLRLETSTGFRSAKWLDRIEVVNRFDIVGNGKGGFFEDTDSYDRLQMI